MTNIIRNRELSRKYMEHVRRKKNAKGLCSYTNCKNKKYKKFINCRKHMKQCRDFSANQRIELKNKVLNYYGKICNCCGEQEILFLSLDHLKNDGRSHRRKTGNGREFYKWIIKNNFPDIFQVLCMNCNWGKYVNKGKCPHNVRRI